MPDELEPLFPEMPEDLSALTLKELNELLAEHQEAAKLIEDDDKGFLLGLTDEQILSQFKAGAKQIKAILAEKDGREEERAGTFDIARDMMKKAFAVEAKAEEPVEEEAAPVEEEAAPDEAEETEAPVAEAAEVVTEEEPEPVTAAVEKPAPPAASPEHQLKPQSKEMLSFVASGGAGLPPGQPLESKSQIGKALASQRIQFGSSVQHHSGGMREFFRTASLDYGDIFPEDRYLDRNAAQNLEKINEVGNPFTPAGQAALTASGGSCAPYEPRYSIPQLASAATPVENSLPFYRASRAGISVPTPGTIGDVLVDQAGGAITTIEMAEDAAGGTFATKTCQDWTCPTYVDVAVTTIAACREFGNMVNMAFPEFVENQMELTRAQMARTSETYLLERIKALSVNVTSGANTASGLAYFVDAIAKSKYNMIGNLRLPLGTRFTALLPYVLREVFTVDNIFTLDGNRFNSIDSILGYLASTGVDVVWYMDGNFAAGDDMIPDGSQGAGALEAWANTFQWAFYPSGTFLGIDMAELNLGVVRDSTLNATNDFDIFFERFLNVARIGPAQAAYWETTTLCANGMLAPAGTARSCES